jgi:hypothetical protein
MSVGLVLGQRFQLWQPTLACTMPPMQSRRASALSILVTATIVSACSSQSSQNGDASVASDAVVADVRSQANDVPQSTRDAATPGSPEVATLCPGTDEYGHARPITAGPTSLPDGVELVVASGSPYVMVVTDNEVYWATQRSIHRVNLADGADKVILDRGSLDNTIEYLAVDATNLYFTEVGLNNEYRVAKMALDGSKAPVTLGGSNSPWEIAVEGDYVYYFDAQLNEIDRLPIAGGTVTTLAGNVKPDSFCLANGHIYFTDQVTPTEDALLSIALDAVASSAVDGGVDGGTSGLVKLASNNAGIGGPSFDAGNLFYSDGSNLMRMSMQTGKATALQTQYSAIGSSPIAAAGGRVYWASGNGDCPNIIRANADGSAQAVLAHSLQWPSALATNSTHLFILTGSRQILRVPR